MNNSKRQLMSHEAYSNMKVNEIKKEWKSPEILQMPINQTSQLPPPAAPEQS